MRLYTESHLTEVLLMGFLNGFLVAMVVHELLSGFSFLKKVLHRTSRIIARSRRIRKIPVQSKIPTAANSEYRV